jgi:hypothetical protein
MVAPDTDARKPRFTYWRGYPGRYEAAFREGAKSVGIAALLMVVLPGGGAIAWFAGSAWGPLKVVFGTLLLAIAGYGAFLTARSGRALLFPRVVPYFEKQLGEGAAFDGGAALAKHAEQLDELALAANVAPLSGFGFADDFAGEAVTWHEPALALATIRTISQQISAGDALLKRDLDRLSETLNLAASKRTRFALLVRTTYAPSDVEAQRRQGFFL